MASEEETDAPLDFVELLGSHDQGEHAKHKLSEPHAEPVDVIFAIGQEIQCLPELGSPAHSVPDRLKFFAA